MNARLAIALATLLPIAPRPAFGFHIFERDDSRVAAANKAYEEKHYDVALRGYEDALREHPNAPELQFDRGNALFKLGREAEAREAYLSALGAKDSDLKAEDYYNMGNALWGLDKKDEAAQAYERALMLDPGFEEARHNLELLLAPPPDAGGQDGGHDGGGGDGGAADGGRSDGGASDAGSDGGGRQQPERPDAGPDGGQSHQQDAGQPPPPQPHDQKHQDAGAKPQPLDQLQASQLLDALRQREKNLQMWKFRMKDQHTQPAEKDW